MNLNNLSFKSMICSQALFKVSEILLVSVIFNGLLALFEVTLLVSVRVEGFRFEFRGSVSVRFCIVLHLFFLSQVSYVLNWVATPNLTSGDESTRLDD